MGDAQVQYLQLDYTKFIPHLIGAVQALFTRVRDLAATVASFADSFTSHRVSTDELCVGSTCITEPQLAALLSQSAAAGLANPSPTIDPTSSQPPPADTTTSTSSEQAASPQAEAVPAPPLAPELLPTASDSSPIVPDQLAGQSDPSTSESIPVSQ